MIANFSDKDSHLLNAVDVTKSTETTAIIIIYDGRLAVTSDIDGSTEFLIDYISKGTVLNAYNCLANIKTSVNVKCLTSVTYYYMPFDILHSVALNYPSLMKTLNEA